ncbi:uncharacterized protein EV420DRAFT_310056 [Desarmillaria tabescens]|uniref:Heterokaryon incompatibility domain-containing protein n=1 Tax=Armillaria tabescens TaxID=1929756 RepID=A0AA39N6M3_ARMTA|nr:uncharacterized protein EV420DRAFT_310056 [Desarmillaria tabescens]KAK0459230.1 hypothetical protein EV420DRAFT_310056 [Desarmillaria tabescens]
MTLVINQLLVNYVNLVWKLRTIFSTAWKLKDSPPDETPDNYPNHNTSALSESQAPIIGQNSRGCQSCLGRDTEPIAPPSSGTALGQSYFQTATVEEQLVSRSVDKGNEFPDYDDYESVVRSRIQTGYEVISAFTETGKPESSIKVPLQREYTGGERKVISSALANVPCTCLGIQGTLDLLNSILRTSYTLDTPSLSSLLEGCISKSYDFGTAYGRLRRVWKTDNPGTMQDLLCRGEGLYQCRQRDALEGNRIVNPLLPPRRVWDLYSNRVVLLGTAFISTRPISHAWVDEKDRVDVWTPINRKEWPVPIPKDADLDLIRIEMLNLGVQYTWLDVLCLRQEGGPREDLRVGEWKLDVPTIGQVYCGGVKAMIYLSGLGRPLSVKEGDLDSDRSWFRRAWTLQEVGKERIIVGDTPDGPMHAKPIDKDGNYETEILTRFHMQVTSLKSRYRRRALFRALANMQKRVSTNPVDKVAGLAFPLLSRTIPAYHESESLEDAWTALVNAMHTVMRATFLFLYPEVGTRKQEMEAVMGAGHDRASASGW